MFARRFLLAGVLALAAFVSSPVGLMGQDQPQPDVPNSKFNFAGVVNASSVNVRSGPADSYYPTMRLSRGATVTVVGYKFDWLKILPPAGSFSYIAKMHVDKQEGTNVGVVNKADVLVRAGSILNTLKTQPQAKLEQGTKVAIIGEQDEYYKIKPPAGVFLYVSKKFVDPVKMVDASSTTRPVDVTVGPGAVAENNVTTNPGTSTDETVVIQGPAATNSDAQEMVATTPTTRPSEIVAAEDEFDRLSKQLTATKDQPLDQQPIPELLEGYQKLVANPHLPSSMRRIAEYHLKYLQLSAEPRKQLLEARKDQESFHKTQESLNAQRAQLEAKLREAGVTVYNAVGTLQTSSLEQNNQPLYRLVDPADNRTLVYIRLNDGTYTSMIGRLVGVRGEMSIDQQLSVKIITPTFMESVDPARVAHGVSAQIAPPSLLKARETQPTTQP